MCFAPMSIASHANTKTFSRLDRNVRCCERILADRKETRRVAEGGPRGVADRLPHCVAEGLPRCIAERLPRSIESSEKGKQAP